MSASASLGYVLIAESDRTVLISTIGGALIGAIFLVITTMMNNSAANRRQRMELHYQRKRSGLVGFLFIVIVGLVVGLLVVATRSNDTTEIADAGPASTSTLPKATTTTTPPTTASPIVTPTTIAGPGPSCAAFTVQVAAVRKAATEAAVAEFEAQAQLLAQALTVLGDLHNGPGDACGASKFTQYYFGPFADGDAARDMCFAIGQVLHDNAATYTQFQKDGVIGYPYYRVVAGIMVKHPDGTQLFCDPTELSI